MTYDDYIREQYGLDDSEMMELFGSDSETQARMLQEHPELRGAVSEMESFICTNIRDFNR
jgi:hypothetical protein